LATNKVNNSLTNVSDSTEEKWKHKLAEVYWKDKLAIAAILSFH